MAPYESVRPRPAGRRPGLLLLVALCCSLWIAPPPVARAADLTVTTAEDELNDDGDCSLREAITASNTDQPVDACGQGSAAGTDAIGFAIGSGPRTIALRSPLPPLTGSVAIDGSTQPGAGSPPGGAPAITLSYTGTVFALDTTTQTTIRALDLSLPEGMPNATWAITAANAQGLTLENLRIRNRRGGISVAGGRDLRIRDNDLDATGFYPYYAVNLSAIEPGTLRGGVELRRNTFGNNRHSLSLSAMRDLVISDGRAPGTNISLEATSGLAATHGTPLTLSGVTSATISHVDLSYSGYYSSATGLAISAINLSDATIEHANLANRSGGIYVAGGRDLRIRDNVLWSLGPSDFAAITLKDILPGSLPGGIDMRGNLFTPKKHGVSLINMRDLIISDGSVPGTNVSLERGSGLGAAGGAALTLSGVTTATVSRLDLSRILPPGNPAGWGIVAQDSSNLMISELSIRDRSGGISVTGGRDVRLRDNDLTGMDQALLLNNIQAGSLPGGIDVRDIRFGANRRALELVSMRDLVISDGSAPGTNIRLEPANGLTSTLETPLTLTNVTTATISRLDLSYQGTPVRGAAISLESSRHIAIDHVNATKRYIGLDLTHTAELSASCVTLADNDFLALVAAGRSSAITLTQSTIGSNSTGYGLFNHGEGLLRAENNYWGAADGPLNLGGSGAGYVGNVSASPFLDNAPVCLHTPIHNLSAASSGPTALGSTTAFTATVAAGNGISYAWDFGDGQTGSGRTPSHAYAATGTYTATVTASNALGSVTAATEAIVINLAPNADAGQDQMLRVGDSGRLWSRYSGDPDHHYPLTYAWTQTAGPAVVLEGADSDQPTFTPTTPGVLTFALRVTDRHGRQSDPDTVNINVIERDITGLEAFSSGDTIVGRTVNFTATVRAGSNVTYHWNFGDGRDAPGAAVSHAYAAAGTYAVIVTASNGANMVQARLQVVVRPAPPIRRLVYLPFVGR